MFSTLFYLLLEKLNFISRKRIPSRASPTDRCLTGVEYLCGVIVLHTNVVLFNVILLFTLFKVWNFENEK